MIVDRRRLTKLAALFCFVTMIWALVTVPAAQALELENVTAWKWTGNTKCQASAIGDVDGDGSVEIITGGDYSDGTYDIAQLCVWNGSTLALEQVTTWYWTSNTYINSVAIGDVDGDQSTEIITGGYYYDETRDIAQLCVWDGATLALEQVTTWYWTGNTYITSVAVGDVDGDQTVEIVTGGFHMDGMRYVAQLCVWNGSTLALENVAVWYWISGTYIYSVAVGDVDGDTDVEVVTGGHYWDYTRYIAQLCVWSGSTLALESVTAWYWTNHTYISSVAVGDVDGDQSMEIVTGGYHIDGSPRMVAQLCVWDGSTLALEDVTTWYWGNLAYIYTVALGEVDNDGSTEIVTGGIYSDGVRTIAQLCIWNGSTLALEDVTAWYWTSDTNIRSVAVGNVNDDTIAEIVTAGEYTDTAVNAQLAVWVSQPPV